MITLQNYPNLTTTLCLYNIPSFSFTIYNIILPLLTFYTLLHSRQVKVIHNTLKYLRELPNTILVSSS